MLSQITDCFAKIFLIIYVICLIQSLKDHYCKSSFGISTISLPQKVFVLSAILKEHDTLIFNTMIFELILKPGKHVLTYTSQASGPERYCQVLSWQRCCMASTGKTKKIE